MILNKQFRRKKSEVFGAGPLAERIEKLVGKDALRWYIAQITEGDVVIEATIDDQSPGGFAAAAEDRCYPGKTAALSLVPTGVGCEIGGYAGDAAPATNLLAATVDYLVTNPNAVNASDFICLNNDRVVYTDGFSIDMFARGRVDLYLPYANKVGLIVEKSDDRQLDVVFNIVNAVRAVHGVDIEEVVITEGPIGGRCLRNESGAFAGTIDNPNVLFNACEKLLSRGVNAIAITSNIQDLPLDYYAVHFDGNFPNPVGGVEAIISYSVATRFQVPVAHAPLMNVKQLDLKHNVVDARGAGEMSSESGLACVLIGLRKAPQIARARTRAVSDVINFNNVLAVVAPATCLGGIPAIYAQQRQIPIIAVEENRTILGASQSDLLFDNVIEVRSYAEAAGVMLALKHGISLASIARPLKTLRY